MTKSIWQETVERPTFPTLSGDSKTDVLIIGGGMTGILCGHLLRAAGVDCMIAEAATICDGVTKNTTAKVTCHHGAIFETMIRRFGVEYARLFVAAQQAAVERYRTLARDINCDFRDAVSYVYTMTDRQKIEKEVAALRLCGCPAEFTTETSLPFAVAGAVKVAGQGQFHPLKFALALAKDLPIYEHTNVRALTADGAVTDHGKITAKKIIVATHFPFINKYGMYFLKLYQHRSYVLALENAPAIEGMYVDASDTGMSFRMYSDTLLLGGGGHRTGKAGGGWETLRAVAKQYYPQATEVAHFATQDCKSLDDIAYIGNYSPRTPSVYVATGYNKWGMTNAMVAATLLTDLVRGKQSVYAPIFSPARSLLRKQLFVNAGESAWGLLRPSTPRCTHLGCALHYNKQEHTWDCACHGSRFSEDGHVIDNPAMREITPKRQEK